VHFSYAQKPIIRASTAPVNGGSAPSGGGRLTAAGDWYYLVIILAFIGDRMKQRTSLVLALGVGALVAAASTAHAVLYKWTEDNGRVVYGDQPPPGAKPEKLNTGIGPADQNAVRDMANKDAEIKKRQQQRADEAIKTAKDDADSKKKFDQCVQARGRIKTLRNDLAVYKYNEKGEKIFYEAADRERAIADNQKLMRDLSCPAVPTT